MYLEEFLGTYGVTINSTPKDILPYCHAHLDGGYIGAYFHDYYGQKVNSYELIVIL